MNELTPNLDPVSLEAQTSIVGSMLIDDACIAPVLAELDERDFPSGPYKSTFQKIKSLFLAGKPVDPVTVLDAMQGGERFHAFLRQCMDLTPTAANALEYCAILRKRTRFGRIRALAQELAEAGDPEVQDALLDKFNGVQADSRVQVVCADAAARDFLERMRARKKPDYLPWGLPGLDRLLEVELGDDVVLGGYSSAGKTLLSVQFALAQARQYRVGYYSLETSTRKLVDRAIAGLSAVPLRTIKDMSYSDRELAQLSASASRYSQLKLEHIDGAGVRSVDDIISTALSRRQQIIYIDYLQILVPPDSYKLYNAVTALSRTLHRAAQTHGITMVLLSQLARPQQIRGKGTTPPTMNSFKESGQIENDADVAMLLYPSDPNDYRSARVLKVAKNKDGPRGQFALDFDGPHMSMRELPEDKSREVAAQLSARGRAVRRKERAQFEEMPEEDPDMPF